jgi:hypothetical protein
MVLDSGILDAGLLVLLGFVTRLGFSRVFAKLEDLGKGLSAVLLMHAQTHETLTQGFRDQHKKLPNGLVQHAVLSIEADGSVNTRFDGTDAEAPYKIWKDLETGVPGQHWFIQGETVLGYLEF